MSRADKEVIKRQKQAVKQVNQLNEELTKQMNDPKKQARKRTSRTGRSKGDKNTIYDEVNQIYTNQFNVSISKEEREHLRQAINSVKRKQKRIFTDTSGKYDAVKSFYSDKGEWRGMLQELSTSINQFKTREQFERFMSTLEKWRQRGYETKRMSEVKDNYIKNLEPTFKHSDPEFLEYLKNMPLEEFYQRRGDEMFTDFTYINSDFMDDEDIYITKLVHSFGYLTREERENEDTAIDSMTHEKITVKSIQEKRKVQKRAKTKKR